MVEFHFFWPFCDPDNGVNLKKILETFHPYLDAVNVDLKAFRDETYQKYVGARLQPVLDSLKVMKRLGIWLEVTTLVVPGVNGDPAELRDAAQFVGEELGVETPWHISRFFPAYKMTDTPPTPVSTLQRAREIGLGAGLEYVYVGNVPDDGSQDTICPGCGRVLIQRPGFVTANRVQNGRCPDCGATFAGIGGWQVDRRTSKETLPKLEQRILTRRLTCIVPYWFRWTARSGRRRYCPMWKNWPSITMPG